MLRQIIAEEVPGDHDWSAPLSDLPIDSFGLVVLRGRIEAALGRPVTDAAWGRVETLNGILALSSVQEPASVSTAAAMERRSLLVNMPQMAMGGLSESWLLKELGDMHWAMITSGLDSPSSALKDGAGNRLYATFTRIGYSLRKQLSAIGEDTRLDLTGTISRFGAGTFISDIALRHDLAPGEARLMSNFSRRGEANNTSLLKGQPTIPPNCPIPEIPLPGFVSEYRDLRARTLAASLFETEYDIIPFTTSMVSGCFTSRPILLSATSARCDIPPSSPSRAPFRATSTTLPMRTLRTVSCSVFTNGNSRKPCSLPRSPCRARAMVS
jgi:hypothetical protein